MFQFGSFLKMSAYVLWVIIVLIATVYDLLYIGDTNSMLALPLAILFLPVTLLVVPIQVMIHEGYLFSLILTYGGGIFGLFLYYFGRMANSEDL